MIESTDTSSVAATLGSAVPDEGMSESRPRPSPPRRALPRAWLSTLLRSVDITTPSADPDCQQRLPERPESSIASLCFDARLPHSSALTNAQRKSNRILASPPLWRRSCDCYLAPVEAQQSAGACWISQSSP